MEQYTFREKVNGLNTKIFMPLMALTFILFNTVINLYIGERMETIQNLLAIAILALLAFWLIFDIRDGLVTWLRQNILVICYFAARAVSCVLSGFDYTVIRSIFFEAFFLIGMCRITLGNRRDFYIKAFIALELLFSAASLILYCFNHATGGSIETFLNNCTYYEISGSALLYANPNTAGIMAGFSIVLAIVLYGKNGYDKRFVLLFGIFNVAALVIFGCRSADVGILFILAVMAVQKYFNCKKKTAVFFSLCLMVLTLIPIYGLIQYNESIEHLSYTEIEAAADRFSSGRYTLWKECIIVQKDNPVFGIGSLNLEQQAREDMMNSLEKRWEYSYRYFSSIELGPHNGYIAQISATGWAGFAFFIAILAQKIKRADHLNRGRWYLLVIYTLVINCFESLFILNRFFTCFYMLLILETDMEQPDEPKKLK